MIHDFLFKKNTTRLIFRLHHIIIPIIIVNLILHILLIMFKLFIKENTLLKLFRILEEKWMMNNICEGYSFLRVNHKKFSKKIFNIGINLFKLLSFSNNSLYVECRVASSQYISFHVMTLIISELPLKGYQANNMKKKSTPSAHKSTDIP